MRRALVVNGVASRVRACVRAQLRLSAGSRANVEGRSFGLARNEPRGATPSPYGGARVVRRALCPYAFVHVRRLAVFNGRRVEKFVAVLPRVVSAGVGEDTAWDVLIREGVPGRVLNLNDPDCGFSVSCLFMLTMIRFRTMRIVVSSRGLLMRRPAGVRVGTFVDVNEGVPTIVDRRGSRSQARVKVSIDDTSRPFMVELVCRVLNELKCFVVARIGLKANGRVAFARARWGPQVGLRATVAVFANEIATLVVLVNDVTSAVGVLRYVLMDRFSGGARFVVFRGRLELRRRVRTPLRRCHGDRQRREAFLRNVQQVRAGYGGDAASCWHAGIQDVAQSSRCVVVCVTLDRLPTSWFFF